MFDVIKSFNEELYEKDFVAHAEFKAVDDESRIIAGLASTKFEDRMEEIIEPSAYKKSLRSFVKNGVILAFHDSRRPVGTPVEASITDVGLHLKVKIGEGTQETEEAWQNIKQKMIKAFSVGFRTLKSKWVEVKAAAEEVPRKIRVITDLELYEVSIVTIPANRQSLFSVSKSLNSPFATDMLDVELNGTDYSETAKAAKSLSESLEDSLLSQRVREINQKLNSL